MERERQHDTRYYTTPHFFLQKYNLSPTVFLSLKYRIFILLFVILLDSQFVYRGIRESHSGSFCGAHPSIDNSFSESKFF